MNKKTFGIFIVILAVILIIGIIYIVFFHDFSKQNDIVVEEVIETPVAKLPVIDAPVKKEPVSVLAPVKKEVTSGDLKRIASSFVERFGSYSNHSEFRNILDLKIFMSKSMQKWADSYVDDLKENSSPTDIYYGVTTKSITSEEIKFDNYEGEAEILIKTQRKDSTGTMKNSKVYYQDIIINFIKENDAWKVNSAYWQ